MIFCNVWPLNFGLWLDWDCQLRSLVSLCSPGWELYRRFMPAETVVTGQNLTLNSSSVCTTLGGTFVGSTCTLSSSGLQWASSGSPGYTLTIAAGYTLDVPTGSSLDNYGTILIYGTLDSTGSVMNHDDSASDTGALIIIESGGYFINDFDTVNHTYGTIKNYGTLTNTGDIQNYGPIVNYCGSTYNGAPEQKSPGTYENAGGTVTSEPCVSTPQFPGLSAFGPGRSLLYFFRHSWLWVESSECHLYRAKTEIILSDTNPSRMPDLTAELKRSSVKHSTSSQSAHSMLAVHSPSDCSFGKLKYFRDFVRRRYMSFNLAGRL